jgi:MFS family permease
MTITHIPRPIRSQPSLTERRAAPRQVAFWLVALVLTITMLGTTLPTPLYVIYQDRAVQGAVVFLLLAVGSLTQVALSRFSSRGVILAGLGLFLAALALIVAALAQSGMALFLAGTVAGGVAVGAIFLGSLAIANRLAPAERRGHVISAFFVACYAGLIIPVVGVGVLSEFTGTFPAVLTLSILLAALCLFSISRFVRVVTPAR